MIKSVFKEIIIILLLIATIILLLGILFYDYIPSSKTLPSKVQEYVLAEDVKTELEQDSENIDTEEVIKTYQLDATDLQHYEKTKEYNKGKVNPFAQYSNSATNTTGNNTNTKNSSSNSNNNSNSSENNENSGTFLNTTGK